MARSSARRSKVASSIFAEGEWLRRRRAPAATSPARFAAGRTCAASTLPDFAGAFLLAVPRRIARAVAAGFVDRLLQVWKPRPGSRWELRRHSCRRALRRHRFRIRRERLLRQLLSQLRRPERRQSQRHRFRCRYPRHRQFQHHRFPCRCPHRLRFPRHRTRCRRPHHRQFRRRRFPSPHRQPLRHPILRPCTRCRFPHRYLNLRPRPFLIRGPIQFLARRILGRLVRHEILPRRRSAESFSPGC